MSNSKGDFDPVAVVVDWLDACRTRRLTTLVDLYDDMAVVDCCEGETFRGRSEVESYWRPKLMRPAADAFQIDALYPESSGGVSLDYRSYDGTLVRTNFRFTAAGKIRHTACAPVKNAA